MSDIADQEHDDQLMRELGLADLGFSLMRLEGRVFLRLTGTVEYGGRRYPYELVPARSEEHTAELSHWE